MSAGRSGDVICSPAPGFGIYFGPAYFLAGWNVLTFCGHWAEEGLDPGAIDRQGGHFFRQLHINDLGGLIYYLATLDHLILVPAFWLLYLGLKAFLAGQQKELPRR